MDSPKLKPCPHCGSTDLQVCWNSVYEDHYVRCYNCRMQGPEIYGREAASEAWNSLPRRHEITPNGVDCQGCPERRYRSHDHPDSLISKRDMAAMLGISPGVAASILEE